MTRVLSPGDDEIGWLAQQALIPLGYLGDAEKTARTFPIIDGIRHSVPGDRARWDADGTIELLGRDSVTINSGGEKIFAEEVEAAIAEHPAVYDVVVTGRPSDRWGKRGRRDRSARRRPAGGRREHHRRGRPSHCALQTAQGRRLLRSGAAVTVWQGRLPVGESASG